MKIAVIGAKGTVGKTLVEHFEFLGYEVLSVDRDTPLTLKKAAAEADIVFVVTLPIEEVANLIAEAVSVMKPETLLVHGTSIEKPLGKEVDLRGIFSKEISLCYLHFHFRPEIPLRRTLFGQHITISGGGERFWRQWKEWVCDQFAPYQPLIHHLEYGTHDRITSISQLVHMVVAALVSGIWSSSPRPIVQKALEIGGPPCKLLVRSVLRTGLGNKVTESILYNHPSTLPLLNKVQAALTCLRGDIVERRKNAISKLLSEGRSILEPSALGPWDDATARLVRLEADIQQSSFRFRFSPEANVTGLLARVLREFDQRGVNKTTTIAQVDPDGGCTFIIGVRELNDTAREAEEAVKSWTV